MGVEEDNGGLGPIEGPLKSPHGLKDGENGLHTEKMLFFALGYSSGTLTHQLFQCGRRCTDA